MARFCVWPLLGFRWKAAQCRPALRGSCWWEQGCQTSLCSQQTLTVGNYVSHCHHQARLLKADTVFDFLETWMRNSVWKQKFKWEKFFFFLWRVLLEKRKWGRERISFFLVLYGIISMKVKTAILLGTKLSYWQNGKSKNYPPSKEPPLGKRGPANWGCSNDSFPTAAFSCEDPAASLHWRARLFVDESPAGLCSNCAGNVFINFTF